MISHDTHVSMEDRFLLEEQPYGPAYRLGMLAHQYVYEMSAV